jgi:hypothetical protein
LNDIKKKKNPDHPYKAGDYQKYEERFSPKWYDETNLAATMPKYKYKYALKQNIKLDYFSQNRNYEAPTILECDLYNRYNREYTNCLKNLAHIEEYSLRTYLSYLEKKSRLDGQIANIYDDLTEQTKS